MALVRKDKSVFVSDLKDADKFMDSIHHLRSMLKLLGINESVPLENDTEIDAFDHAIVNTDTKSVHIRNFKGSMDLREFVPEFRFVKCNIDVLKLGPTPRKIKRVHDLVLFNTSVSRLECTPSNNIKCMGSGFIWNLCYYKEDNEPILLADSRVKPAMHVVTNEKWIDRRDGIDISLLPKKLQRQITGEIRKNEGVKELFGNNIEITQVGIEKILKDAVKFWAVYQREYSVYSQTKCVIVKCDIPEVIEIFTNKMKYRFNDKGEYIIC